MALMIDKMIPDSFWRERGLHGMVTEPDGTIKWYWRGDLDNGKGPAIIEPNGNKRWYSRGIMHRIDGPAAVYPNNPPNTWVVYGKRASNFRQFQTMTGLSDEDILLLKLKFGGI